MDLKKFYGECVRVMKVTKKPDSKEFKTVFKITGLGIAVIGIIGLALHMINQIIV